MLFAQMQFEIYNPLGCVGSEIDPFGSRIRICLKRNIIFHAVNIIPYNQAGGK